MISERSLIDFCSEDFSLIENYDKAIADNTQIWHCHHKLEIQEDKILSRQDLKKQGLYYHRPAKELIFLTRSEHAKLHSLNRSEETKNKIFNSTKNNLNWKNRHHSEKSKEKMSNSKKGKAPWNKGLKFDSLSIDERKRIFGHNKGKPNPKIAERWRKWREAKGLVDNSETENKS